MKKTWIVWAVICVFILSIIIEIAADDSAILGGNVYYTNGVLSMIAIMALNVDIMLSSVLVYKLFYLRPDAVLWTNIEFGYSTLRLLFGVIADLLLHTGTAVPASSATTTSS